MCLSILDDLNYIQSIVKRLFAGLSVIFFSFAKFVSLEAERINSKNIKKLGMKQYAKFTFSRF